MDKDDGQGDFKAEAEQVLQVSGGSGAGHKHDAGLDHLGNFPFIVDEGDTQVELPDLDTGLFRTVLTPRGRQHKLHFSCFLLT